MKNNFGSNIISIKRYDTEDNLFLKGFFDFSKTNPETYRRSESAKEGWRKYRINYKLGKIRESIRTSLGLPSLDNKGFDYNVPEKNN